MVLNATRRSDLRAGRTEWRGWKDGSITSLTPGSLRKNIHQVFFKHAFLHLRGITKIVFRNKQLPKGSEYLKASWTVTYLIKCPARRLSADNWNVWSLQSFAAELWGSHLLALTLTSARLGVCLFVLQQGAQMGLSPHATWECGTHSTTVRSGT